WERGGQPKSGGRRDRQPPTPSGTGDGVRVEVTGGGVKSASRTHVQVWSPGVAKVVRRLPSASEVTITSPLPTDREICLKEFRERNEAAIAANAASTVGLLADPLQGTPLQRVLVNGRKLDGLCTIRLMCKVDSEKGRSGGKP